MKGKQPIVLFAIALVIIVAVVVGIVLSKGGKEAPHDHSTHDHSQGEQAASDTDEVDAVATDTVAITDFAYSPATITVKAGTAVTWTNQDSVMHTVTTEDGAPVSFDSGNFGQGETYSFTFEEPGTYDYYCIPHPYMKGTVVVTE